MGHKNISQKSVSNHTGVSHFESQTRPVFTSYKPFDFSKVAYGHEPSRRTLQPPFAENLQAA
jgi:hypothetical protein